MFLEELAAGLTEQGTVSLECKVVGIPSPTLRWFKDGEEIRSGDILALTPSLEKPVSVYRCDAVNCMGVVSSTSVLDVSQTLSNQWENYVITRKYLTENILETRPPLFSQRPCLIRKWRLASWWSWVLQVWQSEYFPLLTLVGVYQCQWMWRVMISWEQFPVRNIQFVINLASY